MNLVILCDKNTRKYLNRNIDFKEQNYNVLSYENELRPDFDKRVTHILPNILIIFRGYNSRGSELEDIIPKIREKMPELRIIYMYGKIVDEQDFLKVTTMLLKNEIYDISIAEIYNQGFKNEFFTLLQTPMDTEAFEELLKNREEHYRNYDISETLQSEVSKVIDNTKVNFSRSLLTESFSENSLSQLDELQELSDLEQLNICISSVHNSSGLIQTSFELATVLSQAKQSVSLFLPDDVYNRFLKFHDIDTASAGNGCTVNNLPIYPLSASLKNQFAKYRVLAVLDIMDEVFENSDIKIVMCRGTEWDISYLEEYLNLPLSYSKEINYCFYPISQPDFIKFNRAMVKGHCKAYRLRTSPNYTNPCEWNRNVYTEILHLYTDVNTTKKMKLFGR